MTDQRVSQQDAEPLKRPSILVVDDEQRIADTLALILNAKGYAVRHAYEATSALSVYRQTRPDLLISDVVMPGMNGIEMAIAIRHEFAAARILLFSGQASAADLLDNARSRGYEFEMLAKPIHPELLLERIGQMIGAGIPQSA